MRHESRDINKIAKVFQEFSKSTDLANFLVAIFTLDELKQLNSRLKIIQELKKETPQQRIAKKLGVGVATVTRGSKVLQNPRFKNINWG